MAESIRGNAPKGATAGAPDDLLADLQRWRDFTSSPYEQDRLDKAIERIRELEAEREWKPIETAPKNTKILGFWPRSGINEIQYDGFIWTNFNGEWAPPLSWAHLPKPPPAVQVAEGSREAALHQSPGSPPNEGV